MTQHRLSSATRVALTRFLADPMFELIPLANALEQSRHLPAGARVSVTASPHRPLDDGLDLAAELADRGFRVTPHVSARMVTGPDHLTRLLARIDEIGLTSAFVVGGDGDPVGPYFDGLALLEAMAAVGHELELGIPCYPEGHPTITDQALQTALLEKQVHARWMTSQMCFDGSAVSMWAKGIRAEGGKLPLVLGLPGAADRLKLLRISTRIGVGGSLAFLRKNTGFVSQFVRPGGYDPADLLLDLGDELADPALGIAGCHIYTFNQCDTTEEWRRSFLDSLA